jgi:hypothetical protein
MKIKMSYEYGEWSDTINAFWCGGNDTEYIAWKGSHQIYVFPCGEYPNAPSEIIQHTNRIETVGDFNNAMENGIRSRATYIEIGVGAFTQIIKTEEDHSKSRIIKYDFSRG